MEISEERLRQIITRIVRAVLAEQGRVSPPVPEERSAYVVCAKGAEDACLAFLRAYKALSGRLRLTAVTEESGGQTANLIRAESLCTDVITAEQVPEEGGEFSIYPALSRTALCEAALGLDHAFEAKMIHRDFAAGRRVFVLTRGLAPFTGREPAVYRDLILSYIKTLIGMEVRFPKDAGAVDAEAGTASGTVTAPAAGQKAQGAGTLRASGAQIALPTKGNLVTASDIARIPAGACVLLTAQNVITPMAKDVIREKRITVRYC